MSNTTKTKNITMTLSLSDFEDLERLVDYFQEQSISTVTKSDVFKYMIKEFTKAVDNNKMKEMVKVISEKENN